MFLAKSSFNTWPTSLCWTLKLVVWALSLNFVHDSTLFVIYIHQNMPISLILTPFDHFQIRPTFAVTPIRLNLILEPCLIEIGVTLATIYSSDSKSRIWGLSGSFLGHGHYLFPSQSPPNSASWIAKFNNLKSAINSYWSVSPRRGKWPCMWFGVCKSLGQQIVAFYMIHFPI